MANIVDSNTKNLVADSDTYVNQTMVYPCCAMY